MLHFKVLLNTEYVVVYRNYVERYLVTTAVLARLLLQSIIRAVGRSSFLMRPPKDSIVWSEYEYRLRILAPARNQSNHSTTGRCRIL